MPCRRGAAVRRGSAPAQARRAGRPGESSSGSAPPTRGAQRTRARAARRFGSARRARPRARAAHGGLVGRAPRRLARAGVVFAEPNYIRRLARSERPALRATWGSRSRRRHRRAGAWRHARRSSVLVGVVDSGSPTPPDLREHLVNDDRRRQRRRQQRLHRRRPRLGLRRQRAARLQRARTHVADDRRRRTRRGVTGVNQDVTSAARAPLCHPSTGFVRALCGAEKEGFEPSREVFTPLTP